MSEPAPEPQPTPEPTPPEGAPEAKTYDEDYVKNLRSEAAKYRTEAKAAKTEADKFRQSSMSEADKAIADARTAGRTEAVTEFGKRLARTEFDAIAGRRNADFDTASALEWVDLSRFVGDDGEPDAKAIKAAVERLVPAPANGPPSFDGGPRNSAPASQDMNAMLRAATGRA